MHYIRSVGGGVEAPEGGDRVAQEQHAVVEQIRDWVGRTGRGEVMGLGREGRGEVVGLGREDRGEVVGLERPVGEECACFFSLMLNR